MKKSKLEAKILDYAVENSKNPFSKTSIGYEQVHILAGQEDIFEKLENGFINNGMLHRQPTNPSEEERYVDGSVVNLSRSSAFAASAICQLYIAAKVCENIDRFAQDPNNEKYFNDFNSAEEKNAFIEELKSKATERLEVNTKTSHGKDFVQHLSDKLNDYKRSGEHYAESFLSAGLGAVISLNDHLSDKNSVPEAIDSVKKEYENYAKPLGLKHPFENMIWDQLNENASHLAEEKGGLFSDIDSVHYYYQKNKKDIKRENFVKHYQSNKLTEEDREWSKSIVKFYIENMDEVKIGDKVIPTNREMSDQEKEDLHADMVAGLLTGKEVSYKNYNIGVNQRLYLEEISATPFINKDGNQDWDIDMENLRDNLWDKFLNFIRKALGLDKLTNLMNKEKAEDEQLREKLSYEELSGIKNLKNVKSTSAREKERAAEKNTPTMGGL